MKKISILTLSLALSTGFANAAIVIDATATYGQPRTWSPDTTTFDNATLSGGAFDPSSSDKLVVALGFRSSSSTGFTSVTYNGVAMTEAVQHIASSRQMTGIFYLDKSNSTWDGSVGDLAITVDNAGFGYAVSLLAVSGTALDFGVFNSGAGASTTLNSASAGSLVVAQHTIDNDDTVLSFTSPLTDLLLQHAPTDSGDYEGSHISAYANNISAGDFTAAFTGGGTNPSISAVEFTAIPEPSTILLLSAVGSLILLRRRR